jgi:hypothetical protein
MGVAHGAEGPRLAGKGWCEGGRRGPWPRCRGGRMVGQCMQSGWTAVGAVHAGSVGVAPSGSTGVGLGVTQDMCAFWIMGQPGGLRLGMPRCVDAHCGLTRKIAML